MSPGTQPEPFRHEAVLYAGEDELVARAAAFIHEGLAASEPTLIVAAQPKIDRLRSAVRGADGAHFLDMAGVGHNPARILPLWQEFVDSKGGPGVQLRGIGEPIGPERKPAELVECQRHESLLNHAFSGAAGFRLMCPYDTAALSAEVIAEARRSHPIVEQGDGPQASPEYTGVDGVSAGFAASLPEPPSDVRELQLEVGGLGAMRRLVAEEATRYGLNRHRSVDLALAVNEIATNSVEHGKGSARLRIWHDEQRIVCELRDRGRLHDPLADRRIPSTDNPRGRGFWIANQLCDLVQVRSSSAGTVVRLHLGA
jgi:anti-sigma regulatory factor (Ser/Thr protein kinase)